MRALRRKLLRDLRRTASQVATIALVLAVGVAAYVSITGAHRALATSRDDFYARHEFPDVFVQLVRAPESLATRLEAIPGVASVETRLVEPVSFRILGANRPPSGRAISIPASARGLPRSLALQRGRPIDPARDDEILLLETFADAHGFVPGDRVTIVIGGRELHPRVAGLVLSPEYIFPSPQSMSLEAFGVLWMERDVLAEATGKQGVFGDATFQLTGGASQAAVIAAVDRELAPWGGLGAYGRDLQASHRALSSELDELVVLAIQIPAVFLIVAGFLLNVVLSRMVHVQREELAVLRALGYTRWAVARHVLGYAVVIAVLGAVVGLALGVWMGGVLIDVYDDFFHFPLLEVPLDAQVLLTAAAVTLVPAAVGALLAARRVVRLAPAEAMRPPSPVRYHRGFLSRLGLARIAGPLGRMIVRDIERRPVITGISVAGIAFAGAIVILGRFSSDAVDHLMDVIMGRALRGDVIVTLSRPVPRGELDWFRHAPGVLAAEPMRVVPVRLRNGWRSHQTTLSGWPAGADLRSVIDGDANPVTLPTSGVLLTDMLGEKLGVRPGDAITIERLDEDRDTFELTVAALVDERMGLNAYMELDALSDALGEQPQMNGVLLLIDAGARDQLLRRLSDVPTIVDISETRAFRDTFEKQMGEMMSVMTLIVVIFASVIAIGVIYNTARVGLSERGRDLATLRVLGFTRDEVSTVLLGQLAVQVVVALPFSMLFGNLLIRMLIGSISPEEFRFPAVVAPVTYAFASLVVMGAALAAALVVRRRLDRIDIVSALKARD